MAPRVPRRTFLTALGATTLRNAQMPPPRRPAAPRATPASAPPPEEIYRLAGSCVMTGWYGHPLTPEVRGLLRRGALAGLLVGPHNFRDGRAGLAALCAEARAACADRAGPLIAADQEGGHITHLSPPLSEFPSLTALGALDDLGLTHRAGAALGAELREAGVTMDLAPVLDVRTNPNNLVVLNRTFGRDPERVARHGRAMIDGLLSAGVLPCPKHFPGHGATATDSHATLPRLTRDLTELEAVDLLPFRAVAAVTPAVMLAHVVYVALDSTRPATLSRPVAHELLRERVGFTGVAMTDDLQMAAITRDWRIEEAAELSLRAGVDLVLLAHSSAVTLAVIAHLARRATADDTLRARLEEAAGRIRAMRERQAGALPVNPFRVSAASVNREVAQRLAALPDAAARAHTAEHTTDPTLRR